MLRIFIAYRRDDSQGFARSIHDRLALHFGQDAVFRDINDIEPGRPWEEAIDQALGSCEVFVLLIGRGWLEATDEEGNRRIDDPQDRHRREIETAIKRRIRMFVALMEDAHMPRRKELPQMSVGHESEGLQMVPALHALRIADHAFDYGIEELITNIEKAAQQARVTDEEREGAAKGQRETEAGPEPPPPARKREQEDRGGAEDEAVDSADGSKAKRKRRLWTLAAAGLGALAVALVAFLIVSAGDDGGGATVECSQTRAMEAVSSTEFESLVRELGAVPPGDPLFGGSGYVVDDLTCRDLTGDGIEEMVVQLACCTGGSPSPWAIFVAEDSEWELAFHRENIQAELSVQGDAVVEKSPAYLSGDPTCCPTTFRFGSVTWDGADFVYESEEASANRTIEVRSSGATRVGDFLPLTGSPLDAAQVFGPPSLVEPNDVLCVNEWRDLGLVINFVDLGGGDPCSDEGAVGSIELRDVFAEQAGWETDEGVRVGISADELREIYPDAQQQSFPGLRNVLVLIEGSTFIGEGGASPVLSARLKDDAVHELRISVGAAGD